MSNNIEVKHLLKTKRFTENEWKFISLLFYIPIGIILFILRCVLVFSIFLLGYTLPDIQFSRKIINKITFLSFGISVNVENYERKKDNCDIVYVSNNVSVFDNIAVNSVTSAISNGIKLQPLISKSLGIYEFGNTTNIESLKKRIDTIRLNEKLPLYFQPEGKITNGKALLKFQTYPFKLTTTKIQPICIDIERPFLDISITTLGSSIISDIFFYMFSPFTNYKLKFLPIMDKNDLNDDEFIESVRQSLANGLKVETVNLTAKDVIDWEKRHLIELKRLRTVEQINSSSIPVLRRMALQVKEVLPHVPLDDIIKDLYRSRSVDNTISNILEGRVFFTPETPRTTINSMPSSSSSSSSLNIGGGGSSGGSLNFSKLAHERSKSFKERKEQLIAIARKRYIEKHNLDIPL